MQNLYFPKILKIEIDHFSLYTKDKVEINFDKPAACIMGANGIGKSTLLNCITYALTGCINDPRNKKIKSVDDFVENNDYYKEYFNGRINAVDKDSASIQIEFLLNDRNITVKRLFYPTNAVVEFYVDGEKKNNYETYIAATSNLKSFNQFVFIIIKLLTFDESRDCIFWNEFVLTPIMFLCMGADSEIAEKADNLAREIQKVSSLIRNAQWEITKQNNRLNTLIDEKRNVFIQNADKIAKENENIISLEELKSKYDKICDEIKVNEDKLNSCTRSKGSAEAKLSELSVLKLSIENKYSKLYSDVFSQLDILHHPLIKQIVNEGCPICGEKHNTMPKKIQNFVDNDECPLCGANLKNVNQNGYKSAISKLNEADIQIKNVNQQINEKVAELQNLSNTQIEVEKILQQLRESKLEIEGKLYNSKKINVESWDERIETIRSFIEVSNTQKNELQKKMDNLTNEYDKLYTNLQTTYKEIEVKFLPIFRKLAFEFTGLDLYMNLITVTNDKRKLVKFVLRINDSDRNNEFELSESQRFFIDIAFRMALTTFIGENKQCTMLIDTPEGSLDIAYETNAGNLFSEYIKNGLNLILTVNLNSSGLVQTLAEKTGNNLFNLINMLSWVNLSSVQVKHQQLFESAISQIEKRLK